MIYLAIRIYLSPHLVEGVDYLAAERIQRTAARGRRPSLALRRLERLLREREPEPGRLVHVERGVADTEQLAAAATATAVAAGRAGPTDRPDGKEGAGLDGKEGSESTAERKAVPNSTNSTQLSSAHLAALGRAARAEALGGEQHLRPPLPPEVDRVVPGVEQHPLNHRQAGR
eukprot:SAG22_NODE_934_length_6428_cov_3.928267_5_plen_173_part_00